MDRRRLLILAALLGAPRRAWAQRASKVYRVAFLGGTSPSGYAGQLAAFREGLRDLGYVEGQNLVFEFRWAQGKYERLPALAAELVRWNPDVLVTHGGPGSLAAKRATTTIPIVIGVVGDPVAVGAVEGVARPGGNVTGISLFLPELTAKRLEILKEAIPQLTRAGILLKGGNPMASVVLKATEKTAEALKIKLHPVEVQDAADLDNAIEALVKGNAGGFAVQDDALLLAETGRITALARKHQLPAIGSVEYAAAGGLLAFGVNFRDLWRRAAGFVGKILKGAKPADLPIEQATQFELIVNVKTARALGLTIARSLLVRADQIIE